MVLQQSASSPLNRISPPGPSALPFVSTLPFLSNYLHIELNKLAKTYGNIYQLRAGRRNFVVLNDLETIKQALVKQKDSFNGRADFEIYRLPPQRYFMEQKSGEPWKRHHSIFGQVMHTLIVDKADMIENWVLEEAADLADVFIKTDGQPFDTDVYMLRATLSFIQRLVFGKRGSINDPQEDPDFVGTAYSVKKLNKGAKCLTKVQISPLLWQPIVFLSCLKPLLGFLLSAPLLERYLGKNIEQHKNSFDPDNLRDVTDGLLKASSELTESDLNELGLSEKDIVKGSLMQFIGAGTALPNVMVRWALLYMIAYPEFQAEIHKELDEVVGREQQPSLEHRSKLPFTAAFLNEVFRHSSATSLPAFVYATTTDTNLEGYFIPNNTPCLVNYYALTRDERYWEDPEQFNPYRFLDENGKLRNDLTDKFYPFGMGSRRCIGEYLGRMMIFLFFTNLMQKCQFEKVSGQKLSLEPQPTMLLIPPDYKIVAKPRF
ncbi:cytochrome P450 [Nodularia sphaerocarpa]|uniref:cytochrome P450 n=1 Tax=Nodularia sphaerocarpa TaxID=137816 RepID=UPI001EFA8F5E|nr:cytochrome P450 [Nodularia sphaerocarpa]MDB9375785.1 cytochrome P450 [Nodularia sphaerocarpa CS-585]MDB9378128.1 cytochrome P450 [Nodularia sphaerocarpa CS-585A2]ULP71898.1 Putative cytochrome P450 132 [Nodularia sphaerocarpa UHCC 0038]